MIEQEAFDKVWKYFLIEKHNYSFDGDSCYFRSPGGEKCAVGVLIPDEEYNYNFEIRGLDRVIGDCPSLAGLEFDFLNNLQDCHDDAAMNGLVNFYDSFRHRMITLSEDWNLEVPK